MYEMFECLKEVTGIITMLSKQQIEICPLKTPRLLLDINNVEMEIEYMVGDWISVFFDENKCVESRNYIIRAPSSIALLPQVYCVDEKAINVNVNFIPLNEYLYPQSAVKKNFRMCFTFELGNIPLVFINTFKKYKAYSGKAIISFNKHTTELKLENLYKTPWLIIKDDYEVTSDEVLKKNLKKASGLVVKRCNDQVFQVYSQTYGIVYINADGSDIDVGDFVGYYLAAITENHLPQHVGLSPRRISFPHKVVTNADGTVDIFHEISVGDKPVFKDSYYVEKLGDVRDIHALVVDGGRLLRVRSRCVFSMVGVNFDIVEVLPDKYEITNELPLKPSASVTKANVTYYTPTNPRPMPFGRKPRPELLSGMTPVDALVFAKNNSDSVQVYSNDRAIFKYNVATFTTREIDPLPEVGDLLEVILHCVGLPRNRKYVIDWVGKKEDRPFETRIINGVLNIRIPATIGGGFKPTLYHNFFGIIKDKNNRIVLSDDKLVGMKLVHTWIQKIDEGSDMAWAVADDPDLQIETKSPVPQLPTPELQQRKVVMRYVGVKYKGRLAETPPKKDENESTTESGRKSSPIQNTLPKAKATLQRNSTSSRPASRAGQYSPRICKSGERSDVNLQRISQEHSEFFPERFGKVPMSYFNPVKHEVLPKPRQEAASTPRYISEIDPYALADVNKEPNEEDGKEFVAKYSMNGVVVSVCQYGVFVYTDSNPDKEALLVNELMDVKVHHGEWLNFEARWSQNNYMVVSYVKRPPMYRTTTVRNTVELLITDAFVPPRFGIIDNIHARLLTSSFLTTIADPDYVIPRNSDLRGRYLEVVALRCIRKVQKEDPTENNTVNWQLIKVIRIVK